MKGGRAKWVADEDIYSHEVATLSHFTDKFWQVILFTQEMFLGAIFPRVILRLKMRKYEKYVEFEVQTYQVA